ncbi:hypothetical protein JHK84_040057 [Glycine max]|uniref:DUF4283 domain-containing protein n=2 Tax=Glycine subgen. Soja TaxID=1462606 RepID=A0A0R0GD24_SOYBN|nr:hypothetical protein JHK86_039846 [Glycine max]KAG5121717.1 hypothetical protein JHK84_040057 [Glycine max]KAH1094282.1 hypothetical protein GYH30_039819 [Glycine max]RZB68745.1 hypothetical protein D0Y65_038499 [Glycine soja]
MVNGVMQEVLKENDGNSEQNMDGPLISVSNLELMNWATPSFNTLVVNVMERRVNFRTLEAKLQRSWTKNGSIQIIDLHDGFYQVRCRPFFFMNWMVADHYLILKRCRPFFFMNVE